MDNPNPTKTGLRDHARRPNAEAITEYSIVVNGETVEVDGDPARCTITTKEEPCPRQ